ncbi:AraC family transcriptional regulator [Ruminiclostridium cellobioparum]|jgi:AraC family transcriptional regulator|uniref:AraC family transcriptional regulator n=1 Tax=Ruminiclostridium cellobioparum TaxID=29355 RepID=UPI000483F1B2|nr:GyrI-like domain-containing protein [Ruminiclostridium cellobioparum]
MKTEILSNRNQTLKEYYIRINRVIDYIENNLGSELNLETLSKVACFSAYHFHRLFRSITGETLAVYVKKRRIIAAANRIYHFPEVKISQIAYEFGFSGQSDFSRSFKSFFKITPSEFLETRRLKNGLSWHYADFGKELFSSVGKDFFEYDINICRLEDYTVAYIRNTGLSEEHKSEKIEDSFRKLYTWAAARELISPDTHVLGITLDNPEIVPLTECRHDTCITISREAEPDGNIGIRIISSAGRYAACDFDAEEPDFSKSFFKAIDYIYGCWMPQNGYFPEDRPCIERYHKNHENGHIFIELMIPIYPC